VWARQREAGSEKKESLSGRETERERFKRELLKQRERENEPSLQACLGVRREGTFFFLDPFFSSSF